MPGVQEEMMQLYALVWFSLLVLSWNDWAFIAWVALTISPFVLIK